MEIEDKVSQSGGLLSRETRRIIVSGVTPADSRELYLTLYLEESKSSFAKIESGNEHWWRLCNVW